MKHGLTNEPHAKRLYRRLMKKFNKGFTVKESGLIIHKTRPYIAASPDLVVSCKCCGVAVCEIKCHLDTKH